MEKACNEERFLRDVSKHEMTVLNDDGLNRHIRFRNPECYSMSFDIITWPGYLCYCGDMGTYVFSRIPDMFEFFCVKAPESPSKLYINTGYWAEKCEAADKSGIERYSADSLKEDVINYLDEHDASDELRQAVQDDILDYADDESVARQAIQDFVFVDDPDFEFYDFWEHDCKEYTFRYIWCCYALAWGIGKFYESKVEGEKDGQ